MIVEQNRVQINSAKVVAVKKWPKLQNKKDI